jgi:spore cortex formation protein SpoVR/YcgB (stage V sporulation)
MSTLIQGNPWVWVVVQDPGGDEQFLGQHDEEKDVSFIPMFLEKEDASQCLNHLTRDENKKYEVQAIQYEHLARDAAEHGFRLFLLNSAGEILEKIKP